MKKMSNTITNGELPGGLKQKIEIALKQGRFTSYAMVS